MSLISRRSLGLLGTGLLIAAGWPGPAWAQSTAKAGEETLISVAADQSRDSNNRNVRVHNQTGLAIVTLQASSGTSWTGNLLGSGRLAPGRSVVVAIDDGTGACRYALRARFDNGETQERSGINSCQIADYYFTR
jgi:hypothetical protein